MTSRPVLVYTVLRLLAFLVPLVILWFLFPGMPLVAAVMAAAIGVSLSVIFLRRPREEVSSRIYNARQKRTRATDADVEDAMIEDLGIGAGETGAAAVADADSETNAGSGPDAPRATGSAPA